MGTNCKRTGKAGLQGVFSALVKLYYSGTDGPNSGSLNTELTTRMLGSHFP
ncbi:hypothetical protein HMPREF3039_00844 [Akkermansia sp. KLE1798]|nr:hypothetical protein HMPREF3039_00844 [Akkermansia sp. KLE1798]KZA04408.1 hypothetical protein HMPREF1326_01918 [Akkermansia sp. KLE1605]